MSMDKRFRVVTTQDAVSLTISGGATPSDVSDPVYVEGAEAIALTVDHNLTGSNSTDLDIIIYTSEDGVDFDNISYASMNLGAGQKKTIPITVGPRFVEVKVVNNDGSNATDVTTKLTIFD